MIKFTKNDDFDVWLVLCQKRVEASLKNLLPDCCLEPCSLHMAMHHAALSGGKRLRASLAYAVGEALGADNSVLDRVGASIEMIHAFSLVHDDLPAIDNDDLRRGKPSCHCVFGEATALLAGDALHALAFNVISDLSQRQINAPCILRMINILSSATSELIAGEQLDVLMEGNPATLKELQNAYALKTGSLIRASILVGALSANCLDDMLLANLAKFGDLIGLAFQIHDDVIGVESDTKTLGKPTNSDAIRGKPTWPSVVGLAESRKTSRIIFDEAMGVLEKTEIPSDRLEKIARYIIGRNY